MLYRNSFRNIICAASLLISLSLSATPYSSAGNPATGTAAVKTGLEVLRDSGFQELRGKRVGLLTNPSGVDCNFRSAIDIFYAAPEVNLVALYAPEHGVRGDIYAGGRVESGVDETTGLPVYSLYGSTREPLPEMLDGVDVVVYDIQDVGTRSYTFISTLGLMMRACSQKGIEVIVLDRPNPLGGLKVEGSCAEDGFFSFVGQYRIPYVYGLTVGELAMLINEEGLNCGQKGDKAPLKCKLTVIPMQGWSRDMTFLDTGLPWILPSPNIPYPQNAIAYPCSGLAGEMYNYLNIGVGYTLPFCTFAAEWIDADQFKARLESYQLKGIVWRTIHYTPFSGSSKGKLLHGVQFNFTDYEAADITLIQFYVMQAVNELYGKNPFELSPDRVNMFDKVSGSSKVRELFSRNLKVSDLESFWKKDADAFRKLSAKYYLY